MGRETTPICGRASQNTEILRQYNFLQRTIRFCTAISTKPIAGELDYEDAQPKQEKWA